MGTAKSYRGHVANGQIALDEPSDLPERAAVSVRLLKPEPAPAASSRLTREQILQLPLDQRRQLLATQSARLADEYASDANRALSPVSAGSRLS